MNPPLPPPPLLSATIIAPSSTGLPSGAAQKSASGSTEQITHLRPQARPSV